MSQNYTLDWLLLAAMAVSSHNDILTQISITEKNTVNFFP